MKNRKHKIVESFGDFVRGSETIQTPNKVEPAQFGANPGDQGELPFEFERSPEIGERPSSTTLMMERIQALADAGVNKSNSMNRKRQEISPYIDRHLQLAYKHLREAYLRLMDMK
jgi:hypothetical protein